MRTKTISALLVAVLSLAGSPHQGEAGSAAPPAWERIGAAKTHDRRTVWQAINGAAELYLTYGFKGLTLSNYIQGKNKAAVQVYDLGRPINAFGVFWRQRPASGTSLDRGRGAIYDAPAFCAAFIDRFYVNVLLSEGALNRRGCATLLNTVIKGLSGKAAPPAEIALLPQAYRLAGTIRYASKSFLGLRELSRCLHARYPLKKKRARGKKEPASFTRFVMLPGDGASVESIWRGLGKRWKPAKGHKGRVLYRTIPYQGTVAVTLINKVIHGVAGVGDLGATLEVLGPTDNKRRISTQHE